MRSLHASSPEKPISTSALAAMQLPHGCDQGGKEAKEAFVV
jgi:hypothetical protein